MNTVTKFCPECRSLLYIEKMTEVLNEVVDRRKDDQVFLLCRKCEHQEKLPDKCIYRKVYISREEKLKTSSYAELAEDPTLPVANGKICSSCGESDPVFLHQKLLNSQKELAPTFICRNKRCGNVWK
eukprot:GHVP01043995.1.p1 GENE.GHVP01043995.1~~GHVP01043995.1.p1  ORF type:complete len:127 (-),score=19.96 GHVP01043995.1:60-440(-)